MAQNGTHSHHPACRQATTAHQLFNIKLLVHHACSWYAGSQYAVIVLKLEQDLLGAAPLAVSRATEEPVRWNRWTPSLLGSSIAIARTMSCASSKVCKQRTSRDAYPLRRMVWCSSVSNCVWRTVLSCYNAYSRLKCVLGIRMRSSCKQVCKSICALRDLYLQLQVAPWMGSRCQASKG
jgi:hypothetical protein